jgi:predicted RNA-binding Zn ribbon-like protein
MKKPLLGQEEVFLVEEQGRIRLWDFRIEEILEAANSNLDKKTAIWLPGDDVLPTLRHWVHRYFDEGVTEDFLNDLNSAMNQVRYSKYVLTPDLLPSESGYPRAGYVEERDQLFSEAAYAASEFSKILTSGMLKRVKQCQMENCGKLFVGPRQAKWCSKSCGSKYRVRKKRKRESG